MSEQEKTLLLEMVRRLANLEKALNSLLLYRQRAMVQELGSIEDHLGLKRTIQPREERKNS